MATGPSILLQLGSIGRALGSAGAACMLCVIAEPDLPQEHTQIHQKRALSMSPTGRAGSAADEAGGRPLLASPSSAVPERVVAS